VLAESPRRSVSSFEVAIGLTLICGHTRIAIVKFHVFQNSGKAAFIRTELVQLMQTNDSG
jgi:hypothetical protein